MFLVSTLEIYEKAFPQPMFFEITLFVDVELCSHSTLFHSPIGFVLHCDQIIFLFWKEEVWTLCSVPELFFLLVPTSLFNTIRNRSPIVCYSSIQGVRITLPKAKPTIEQLI